MKNSYKNVDKSRSENAQYVEK